MDAIGGLLVGFSVHASDQQSWHAGAGVFFGSDADGGSDGTMDEAVSVHARTSFAPVNEETLSVDLGASASVLLQPKQDDTTRNCRLRNRPEIRIDGTRFIDARSQSIFSNDRCWFWGVEAAVTWRRFWVQGEYFNFGFDQIRNPGDRTDVSEDGPNINFDSAYVSGGVFLTGEHRPYDARAARFRAPKVGRPFSLAEGGTGAWEIAARLSHANLDDNEQATDPVTGRFVGVRGNAETNWTVGLNWYVNDYVMMKFNYINANVVDFADLNVADFDVYAMRFQVKW